RNERHCVRQQVGLAREAKHFRISRIHRKGGHHSTDWRDRGSYNLFVHITRPIGVTEDRTIFLFCLPMKVSSFKASSITSRFSAERRDSILGGEGNGKLATLSIPIDF